MRRTPGIDMVSGRRSPPTATSSRCSPRSTGEPVITAEIPVTPAAPTPARPRPPGLGGARDGHRGEHPRAGRRADASRHRACGPAGLRAPAAGRRGLSRRGAPTATCCASSTGRSTTCTPWVAGTSSSSASRPRTAPTACSPPGARREGRPSRCSTRPAVKGWARRRGRGAPRRRARDRLQPRRRWRRRRRGRTRAVRHRADVADRARRTPARRAGSRTSWPCAAAGSRPLGGGRTRRPRRRPADRAGGRANPARAPSWARPHVGRRVGERPRGTPDGWPGCSRSATRSTRSSSSDERPRLGTAGFTWPAPSSTGGRTPLSRARWPLLCSTHHAGLQQGSRLEPQAGSWSDRSSACSRVRTRRRPGPVGWRTCGAPPLLPPCRRRLPRTRRVPRRRRGLARPARRRSPTGGCSGVVAGAGTAVAAPSAGRLPSVPPRRPWAPARGPQLSAQPARGPRPATRRR